MRSHDYCHFEVVLGSDGGPLGELSLGQVDELRKDAARLVDKAVEQFKTFKAAEVKRLRQAETREFTEGRVAGIRAVPEGERTEEQKAVLKAWDDERFEVMRRYDYEDDWQDEDEAS